MTAPVGAGGTRWDREALRAGATVAVAFVAPFAVVGRIAVDAGWPDAVVAACNLGMVGGLVLAAGVTAWRQRCGTPLSHGIVVALATYFLLQSVLVAARVLRGDELGLLAILFNAAFALGAGLVGGLLGQMLLGRGFGPPPRPSSRP